MLKFQYLIIFVFFHFVCIRTHRCIHDEITQKNLKLTPINDTYDHRLLQSNGFGPIRIHYIYNTTDISTNQAIGQNVIKIMDIIKSFWQKVIQVDYLPFLSFNVDSNQNRDNFACFTFQVPRTILDNPIQNKDFGLLVEAKDDGQNGVTAYSNPCAYSSSQNKPTWGFIHWNKFYMAFDPLSFQQNVHIAIHETLHILGFNTILYSFYKTGKQITVGRSSYIAGPYINEQVKKQYGCSSPNGMLLESKGGSGTALSHWSKKAALNQLMTAGVSISNPTISYITLALLQQTGWYRRIYKTYGKFINFGYKKGCAILSPTNCSSNQYCNNLNVNQCDYDRTALGYCKNDSLSDCLFVKYYVNFICIDPNYQTKSLHSQILSSTGQKGGMNSRCFDSSLYIAGSQPSKHQFRCYQVVCSATRKTLTIRVGKTFGLCLFPGQVIKVKGYDGNLTCPLSFQALCAVQRCPKQCNSNGVCLNGKCLCASNYAGQSCNQISTKGLTSKTSIFLPQNNNNCLIGSYLTVFGDCEPCHYLKCAKCNQLACLLCINQSLPKRGRCN